MDVKQSVSIGTEVYQSLLKGLTLLNLNTSKSEILAKSVVLKETKVNSSIVKEENLKSKSCSTCQSFFSDDDKFRQHFKEDWHRYNSKLSLKDRKPLSEKEFEELEDDVSSISGSESDSSDDECEDANNEAFMKEARILFQNSDKQVLSIYHCLLASKKDNVLEEELVLQAKRLVKSPSCLIMMLGGGHFAAAIFKNDEIILHKTFHAYTVRQKQGSSQSSNDNKGNKAKSAGASLRRYNETVLGQHIQDTTVSWASEIELCDFIFYRAVGPGNKKIFFSGKNAPLNKNDLRLRTIPFNTRRATFNEVKRVHNCLKSVLVYDLDQVLSNTTKPQGFAKQKEEITPEKSKYGGINRMEVSEKDFELVNWAFGSLCGLKEVVTETRNDETIDVKKNIFDEMNNPSSEEEKEAIDNPSVEESEHQPEPDPIEEIQKTKKKKKRKKPKQKIPDESVTPDAYLNCIFLSALEQEDHFILENCIAENVDNKHLRKGLNSYIDNDKNTLLHFAAKKGFFHHVRVLLEAGASPCYKNKAAHTAYDVSVNKDTRDTFRRFYAEFPDKFDYSNSHIPKPLTDDLINAQIEKKREKNRKLKQRVKEKKLKEKEEEDKQRFLQLSDREKRALAAERRLLAQQTESSTTLPINISRCYICGCDMTGKIPFEYDSYKFCAMSCLKVHRNNKLEGS